jgi:hypothetical protein
MRVIETEGTVWHIGYTLAGRLVCTEKTGDGPWKLHWRNLEETYDSWCEVLPRAWRIWLSPCAHHIAIVEKAETVRIFRIREDGIEATAGVPNCRLGEHQAASLSANGRFFAWSCPARAHSEIPHHIRWRELEAWNVEGTFRPFEESQRLDFSDDGEFLVSAGWRSITAWNMKLRDSVATWRLPGDADVASLHSTICSLKCAPNGKSVCAGLKNQTYVWDAASGDIRMQIQHPFDAAVFSSDSRILALAHESRVELWEAATSRQLNAYEWPVRHLSCLAFAPDGLTMAAGGHRGIVIWDVDA